MSALKRRLESEGNCFRRNSRKFGCKRKFNLPLKINEILSKLYNHLDRGYSLHVSLSVVLALGAKFLHIRRARWFQPEGRPWRREILADLGKMIGQDCGLIASFLVVVGLRTQLITQMLGHRVSKSVLYDNKIKRMKRRFCTHGS